MKKLIISALIIILLFLWNACTVVSANRVFPTLKWYWSPEAKEQRREQKIEHPEK